MVFLSRLYSFKLTLKRLNQPSRQLSLLIPDSQLGCGLNFKFPTFHNGMVACTMHGDTHDWTYDSHKLSQDTNWESIDTGVFLDYRTWTLKEIFTCFPKGWDKW